MREPVQIATKFKKNGFEFRLMERVGVVALFEKTMENVSRKWWEVCIIQTDQDREIGGTLIPAHERMPGSEKWGSLGWTLTTFEKAKAKFDEKTAEQLEVLSEYQVGSAG